MNIIVIPVYNHYDLTNKLLFSLFHKEKERIGKIIVVDDCSPDPIVASGLSWLKSQWGIIEIVRNEENLGFLKSSNKGLRLANSNPDDHLILLSNDVLIYGKFIEQIEDNLKTQKSLVGGIVYQRDTGWNKFGDKIFPYLEGWLLAATSASWNTLGYFDERYAPCDFEDVDLSTQALAMGYDLIALNNPSLRHMGGQSIGFNPSREAQTKINQKKFEEKWVIK